MRINWVSFLDPRVYSGGGEMVGRRLLEVGMSRGHQFRIASVRPAGDALFTSPDVSVLVDIYNHGHSLRSLGAWRGFGQRVLDEIMQSGPFVHFTNAYVDVCNLPYLPCSGQRAGLECSQKESLGLLQKCVLRDWQPVCTALRPEVAQLYERSALNVYVSPLHQAVTERLLASERVAPGYVLRPLIDTERFANAHRERDIDYLFVGVLSEAKGFGEMRRRFGGTDIHLLGRCAPGIRPDFGRSLGHVPYEKIPSYMNRAKNFVFLPRWPEPQGRVVAEAALCGCNIIANENVGALSFPMDLADPKNYVGAEDEFWARIEGLAA